MGKCKKCKKPMITMRGTLYLEPDAEPYENGKEESIEMELDDHIYGEYCEHCEKIEWLMIDRNDQLLESSIKKKK